MRAQIDVRYMVAKFMATYSYRLPEVLEMPFVHFCELHHMVDSVWADHKLEDYRPVKQLVQERDRHFHLLVVAPGTKQYEQDKMEGMKQMNKLRKLRSNKDGA